jgi:peptidoglycan/LPS O-acetylase OafA/YrhL
LLIQLLVGVALPSFTGAAPRVTNWHADFIVAAMLLICIPVNFGLSILSYRYGEVPMIDWRGKWARRVEGRFLGPTRRMA